MITKPIEIDLFKVFVDSGISDSKVFNDLIKMIELLIEKERGFADAEFYEILTKLTNNENNAGWDSKERHKARLDLIHSFMIEISDRSEEYLP